MINIENLLEINIKVYFGINKSTYNPTNYELHLENIMRNNITSINIHYHLYLAFQTPFVACMQNLLQLIQIDPLISAVQLQEVSVDQLQQSNKPYNKCTFIQI